MVRRRFMLALLVLIAAALLPAARSVPFVKAEEAPPDALAAASTPSGPLGSFMGMVVRDPHYEWQTNALYAGTNQAFYETMGQMLKAAGVKWVRIEIFAEELAPVSGQPDLRGRVNTAEYAYFINVVAPKYGFKVLALLSTPLVRQRPTGDPTALPPDSSGKAYAPGEYINPERIEDGLSVNLGGPIGSINPYMRVWLENAFQVAQAFPYNPTTGAGIAAFEVMNEENRYLAGGGRGMSPDRIGDLMTKYYRAYRAGYPAATPDPQRAATRLIVGGLHPDRCNDCAVGGLNDRQYLDRIYKSSGVAGYRAANGKYPWDGIGYHPYAAEMRSGAVEEPTAINDLYRVPIRMDAIRNVMVGNGDAGTKLWVTEVGDRGAPLTVDPPGDNERNQAYFMRRIYQLLWQRHAFIENVFWFKYEDFAVPATDSVPGPENWGVVRLVRRPADQPCPQTAPVGNQSCDYDQNGAIQRVKLSYSTYADIAQNGFLLYTVRLPQLPN